ncbi:GSCOCG00000185001-RA-CDS, partial [Cotesia congregata]
FVCITGAEDVFRFTGNETHTDFFRLVLRDGNYLLVGGRNLVHNLSLTDLTEQQRLTWYSSDTDVKMCVVKGKDEENCQNYVRILAKTSASNLLVCATNAFKPMCRDYVVHSGNYTMASEKAGQALCPYDPQQNSTFVHVDGELYTGTVADFSGMDPIIYREPLQTEQYDSMSLNVEKFHQRTIYFIIYIHKGSRVIRQNSYDQSIIEFCDIFTLFIDLFCLRVFELSKKVPPNFVNSMTLGDFVYFFFRETAVEYINCGKAVYSRVARVCKYDRGGPHRFRNRWTSFLKSRLNCSVTGDFPFYFNEIREFL